MKLNWWDRLTAPELPVPQPGLAALHLVQVKKNYRTGAGEFEALKGISLEVEQGEFVAVVGKSGSGKSTLINLIAGIDRPTAGEVWVAGTPVHTLNENQIAVWRGKTVGIVFQFFQLLPTLTVLENVMLPMDFCHVYDKEDRPRRALALLQRVGVDDQADKLPASLSGGQQQRVAIARALAAKPAIILADEPTGNLDSRTSQDVLGLMKITSQKFVQTIVMITHNEEIAQLADRIIRIEDGLIVTR